MLGIVRSPREHQVVVPAGWDCYEFMLSEELIRRTEMFPPKFFDKTTQIEDAYLPLVEPESVQFLMGLDFLFARLRKSKRQFDGAVCRAELLSFATRGLRKVIDRGLAARGDPPRSTRRPDLVSKAKMFIDAHPKMEINAEEIAQSIGVSYRALNHAFQDAFGTGPYRYFLIERLHAARRALRSSDASVTDACYSNGFSTPSRFARQYKRLFNELPSETRRINQQI